nr:hypothetical protein BgiMline_005880 [Biomphalaria glabrata]
MRKPVCNSVYRRLPAAVLEGAPGHLVPEDICEVTLSAPGRYVWMVKVENVEIFDCDVVLQLFDGQIDPPVGKPLLSQSCVSSDPGIVHVDSSTITIRLLHSNSSNYSFSLIATARKDVTKADSTCGGYRCKNNHCISKSLMCDAVDNCFDFSDETANGTSFCEASTWPFQAENWGVLISVLGAGLVLGITAACCRHIRQKRQSSVDDLYELNEGPYVHKYGPPRNQTLPMLYWVVTVTCIITPPTYESKIYCQTVSQVPDMMDEK